MNSLRKRLMLVIGSVTAIVCLIFAFGAYYQSSRALIRETEESLMELARATGDLVDEQLSQIMATISVVANRRILTDGTPWEEVARELQREAERLGYQSFGIADLQGINRRSDGATANVADRDHFRKALRGEANISDVLISRATNEPIMTVAVPIERNNRIEGVFVAVRDTNLLDRVVETVGLGKRGYAFIVNEEGTIVSHQNRDLVINQVNYVQEAEKDDTYKELAAVLTAAVRGNIGVGRYTYEGSPRLVGYAPIGDSGWTIVVASYVDDVMEPVYALLWIFLSLTIVAIAVGLIIAYFTSTPIAKPIEVLTGLVERISNLDLTFEEDHEAVEYIKRKDEIGTTARALAAMQKNLMEVIKVLQEVGHRIASTSETLAASSEENSATIEEIASSVDSFSQGIGATKERADVMRKDADIIENLALEGSQQMDATKGSMDKIVEASNAVKVSLGELASGVKNMEGILNMISDVADQTNLLALNAAIEAARAGEHGRGFAVVAEEIRQLAEQTQSSVGDITRMINQLVSDVNLSLETMENAEKEITGGSETLVKTQEDFLAITERIAATVKGIEEIAQSIDSMNQTSESIAAASEEQAASMQEVARNTETLAQMGAELREIVNRFRL